MDETPRPPERWLPLLGIALIAESAAGFHVALTDRSDSPYGAPAYSVLSAVLLAVLGLVVLIPRIRAVVAMRISLWSFGTIVVLNYLPSIIGDPNQIHRPLSSLQLPVMLLLGLGPAILWGAAMIRRERPLDPQIAQFGRIGAGLAQAGFVFASFQEFSGAGQLNRYFGPAMGIYGLFTLLRVASRIVLLWGSIEMMRSSMEADVLQARMSRVHRLMIGWICLVAASSVTTAFYWIASSATAPRSHMEANLWRGAVYVTLALTAALAVAKSLRTRPAAA